MVRRSAATALVRAGPRGAATTPRVTKGARARSSARACARARAALARRPAACDCLVLSLGYDTLEGDPDARAGHRLALTPADFGRMRGVLRETGLPICAVQEGGYHLEAIPDAAEAFWASPPPAPPAAAGP